MGWIPGPDIDLGELANEELVALKELMLAELAMTKARTQRINNLISARASPVRMPANRFTDTMTTTVTTKMNSSDRP